MIENISPPICVYCDSKYQEEQWVSGKVWNHDEGSGCRLCSSYVSSVICPYCFSEVYVCNKKGIPFSFCCNYKCDLYTVNLISDIYLKVYYNKFILFNCKLKDRVYLYLRKKFNENLYYKSVYKNLFVKLLKFHHIKILHNEELDSIKFVLDRKYLESEDPRLVIGEEYKQLSLTEECSYE